MPAYARRQIVDESVVGVYHCMARCVRRAFLCGFDRYSGQSFDHRKISIRKRLEELAGIVAVDVLNFAVLGLRVPELQDATAVQPADPALGNQRRGLQWQRRHSACLGRPVGELLPELFLRRLSKLLRRADLLPVLRRRAVQRGKLLPRQSRRCLRRRRRRHAP